MRKNEEREINTRSLLSLVFFLLSSCFLYSSGTWVSTSGSCFLLYRPLMCFPFLVSFLGWFLLSTGDGVTGECVKLKEASVRLGHVFPFGTIMTRN